MTSPAERIIEIYDRQASAWDEDRRLRRLDGERRWIERFLAGTEPGSSVLDLGCGGGEPIARDLIAAGHRVTGVDSSPSLVARCEARFPGHTFVVADMRRLELGLRFPAILAWHSFFHLTAPDQEGMFPVFARHAAPGAALMFTSGTRRGEAIGSFRGEPLYHASLDPSEYESLLKFHGFSVVDYLEDDPECGGATVWLAKARALR